MSTSARIEHPTWCHPGQCIAGLADVEHGSQVRVFETPDDVVTGSLVRVDEPAFPDDPGTVHVRIDATSKHLVEVGWQQMIPVGQIPAYVVWLLGLYLQAQAGSEALAGTDRADGLR